MNPAAVLAKWRANKKYKPKTVHKAASELGRAGGLCGGPARAAALSDSERRAIASHAAKVRWGIASEYVRGGMLDRTKNK